MFEPKAYRFRRGNTCLSQSRIFFRNRSSCLSREHNIFKKEIHVSAKKHIIRLRGSTCFDFCGLARPNPAFTKVDICTWSAQSKFLAPRRNPTSHYAKVTNKSIPKSETMSFVDAFSAHFGPGGHRRGPENQ